MLDSAIERDLRIQLSRLALEQQQQVVAFARTLAEHRPVGLPGESYCAFAGSIAAKDLAQMEAAIEEGCERLDANEW